MSAVDTPLSEDELERICAWLYRRTGMIFGEKKRYYIERRVSDRIEKAGSPTVEHYIGLLRADADEGQRLINSFTVNETYFYREEHQLRCLTSDLLPEIIRGKRPGDKIRIWSNPCSTGEEAYSIALWLLENWPFVDAFNVEIVGSDIDTAALSAAREADYGERALSKLPADVRDAYFERARHRRRRLIPDLQESVIFTSVNLIEPASMAAQGRFDVIFCRNVLIYFDDESRQTAARTLFNALEPGGFLCLGHTESMTRISNAFALRRFNTALVYQRPGDPARG